MATKKTAKKVDPAYNGDFNDEESVLAEMARELDIDPDQLKIREGRSGFGVTTYEITIQGGGHKEWSVVENEDQERELAIEIVKQDLDESPENFTQSWLEGYINTDRLRRDLESDVLNMNIETLQDRSTDEFWREAESAGVDVPEKDEDGELPEPDQSTIEMVAEKQTEDQLKDPMQYIEDMYSREDAVKQAIQIAGIDIVNIDAAAEDAVNTDGPAHFLSSYDDNSYTTKGGLVYWRTN
jgi:hypothetical protein